MKTVLFIFCVLYLLKSTEAGRDIEIANNDKSQAKSLQVGFQLLFY